MHFNKRSKFREARHALLHFASKNLAAQRLHFWKRFIDQKVAFEQLEEIVQILLALSQTGPLIQSLDIFNQHFSRFRAIGLKLVVAEVESEVAGYLRGQVPSIEAPRPQHIHIHFDVRDDSLD